jgi:hypothetical protein
MMALPFQVRARIPFGTLTARGSANPAAAQVVKKTWHSFKSGVNQNWGKCDTCAGFMDQALRRVRRTGHVG